MSIHHIPAGYHSVTPYLVINGAARAIDFYRDVFGAVEIMRMPGPDGKIGHAEIKIGDSHIMLADEHPEQGFRSCLGILRLGRTYGSDRLEAASTRACNLNACSYKSVKSILSTGLDRQLQAELPLDRPPIQHTNIRGTDYFNRQEKPSC